MLNYDGAHVHDGDAQQRLAKESVVAADSAGLIGREERQHLRYRPHHWCCCEADERTSSAGVDSYSIDSANVANVIAMLNGASAFDQF